MICNNLKSIGDGTHCDHSKPVLIGSIRIEFVKLLGLSLNYVSGFSAFAIYLTWQMQRKWTVTQISIYGE
jgi:hypothetical protein